MNYPLRLGDAVLLFFAACSAPVVNEDKMKGRLSTLANNRNAIAHGRELASVIGGRYTISEIENITSVPLKLGRY